MGTRTHSATALQQIRSWNVVKPDGTWDFDTFVLQGGEDPCYTDEKICQIVRQIKEKYPDCAVTLSIGEKSRESYEAYFEAGADRYLLRHETANEKHYRKLHPEEMSLSYRKNCLKILKEIGYQTGCGFMVGSPGQTIDTLYEDLMFIKELKPQMVGIGPFIPHQDSSFQGRTCRYTGNDPAVVGCYPPDPAWSTFAGDYCTGNYSSQRQGKGSSGRSQCGYA